MKRYSKLYKNVYNLDNIEQAFKEVRKNIARIQTVITEKAE